MLKSFALDDLSFVSRSVFVIALFQAVAPVCRCMDYKRLKDGSCAEWAEWTDWFRRLVGQQDASQIVLRTPQTGEPLFARPDPDSTPTLRVKETGR